MKRCNRYQTAGGAEPVAGQAVFVASKPPLRLPENRLADEEQSLEWVIELKQQRGKNDR